MKGEADRRRLILGAPPHENRYNVLIIPHISAEYPKNITVDFIFYVSFSQTVVRRCSPGGPQAVSEKNDRKIVSDTEQKKMHPHMSVLQLSLFVDENIWANYFFPQLHILQSLF
jgi:hypothetical protein